jgi:RNA polymerase sigma factor (TIGR02999 family)
LTGADGSGREIDDLMQAAQAGDAHAAEALWTHVYEQLRAMARGVLRGQNRGRTMQTTVLVHEVYLKILSGERRFDGEQIFFLTAASAMRSILIDYARARARLKRQAPGARVLLDDLIHHLDEQRIDLLGLDEALDRLSRLDERKARVVELRFFAGLDIERTAEVLGVGHATVERDWRLARSWLKRELAGKEGGA